jgi:hypothetical protein
LELDCNGNLVLAFTCNHASWRWPWQWIIHVNVVGASGKCTQMATWWFFTRTLNKFWSLMTFRPLMNLKRFFFSFHVHGQFFHRRYRMRYKFFYKSWMLFMFKIFILCNVCGHLGLYSIQKCIIILWMLTYDIVVDAINEYYHLVETTTTKCL